MIYLKLFEKFDESLVEEINESDYFSWQKRIIGPPNSEDIITIRDQISKVELHFKEEYSKYRERLWGTSYEYHRKPSFINNGSTDLMIQISLCDDEWYIVNVYSVWRHYYFLCDTSDGLNQLSDIIIQKLFDH